MMVAYLIIGMMAGMVLGALAHHIYDSTPKQRVPTDDDLAKIIDLLETRDKITNDDLQELLGVSDATASRYLKRLSDKRIIRRQGKGRGVYYTRSGI